MFSNSKTGFGQTTEKMTWNENLLNTMLLELINIQTFYIDHFSIWESLCKQYSPNLESHTNFMKLYVGSVDFELHFANTLSNAKIVYLWNVDLDEWSNIGIHEFSIWGHPWFWKLAFRYEFFQISKLSGLNFFKWKCDHYRKCRSWRVEQTLYSWVFYLRPSRARSKCVFVKPTILTLVKLGQMTHLSTSNGKLLNSKLLGLIKTYISYMDHIFIRINVIESEARVFKFEDGLWSNLVKRRRKWLGMEIFWIPSC